MLSNLWRRWVFTIERRMTRLEHKMADITQALTDLDGLLSDVETEVAQLKSEIAAGGNVQGVADSIESKIAAARAALADTTPEPPAAQ